MAKRTPGGNDRTIFLASGTIAAAAAVPSPWVSPYGSFNLWIWGLTGGSLALVASFDGGSTEIPVIGADGQPQTFTASSRVIIDEPESGVVYRLEPTGLTADAHWRFSK